jgi:integrase
MPKQRKSDLDLPSRVYKKHNAYYFVGPDNKWIRLATSKATAIAKYHQMINAPVRLNTMADVIDRYMKEISPTKAASTHKKEIPRASNLRAGFGHIPPDQIKTTMVYEYIDLRSETAPKGVNKEIALLSHMFKKAIRWGVLESNPVLGVERNKETPRKRYITDDEFKNFLSICPEWLRLYCELKYLTGFRQTDMLKLRWNQVSQDGINLEISKTSRELMMTNSDALSDVLNRIRSVKKPVSGLYLFHTNKGQPYTPDGFRTMFHRYMRKAIDKGLLSETFQERDIRAKAGSDSESAEAASGLLDHADGKVTRRHYRRKAEVIKPLR